MLAIHTDNSIKTNILRSVQYQWRYSQYSYYRHGQDNKHNWEKLQYTISFTIYSGWCKIDKPKKYEDYHKQNCKLKHYSDTSSRVTVDNNFLKNTPSWAIKEPKIPYNWNSSDLGRTAERCWLCKCYPSMTNVRLI